jgi:hypothetical protein
MKPWAGSRVARRVRVSWLRRTPCYAERRGGGHRVRAGHNLQAWDSVRRRVAFDSRATRHR